MHPQGFVPVMKHARWRRFHWTALLFGLLSEWGLILMPHTLLLKRFVGQPFCTYCISLSASSTVAIAPNNLDSRVTFLSSSQRHYVLCIALR